MKKFSVNFVSKTIIIISILIIIYLIICPIKKETEIAHVNGAMTQYRLSENDTLNYKFISKLDSLSKVSLFIKNNSKSNEKCSINISLFNKDKKIYSKRIKNTSIDSSEFTSLKFNELENTKGVQFTLVLENYCKKAISIHLYDINDDSSMTYNGMDTNKGIVIRESVQKNSNSYFWYPIMLSLIGMLILVMTFNFKGDKNAKKNTK